MISQHKSFKTPKQAEGYYWPLCMRFTLTNPGERAFSVDDAIEIFLLAGDIVRFSCCVTVSLIKLSELHESTKAFTGWSLTLISVAACDRF